MNPLYKVQFHTIRERDDLLIYWAELILLLWRILATSNIPPGTRCGHCPTSDVSSTCLFAHLLAEVHIRGEIGGLETVSPAGSPPIVTPTLSREDGSYRMQRKIPSPRIIILP